MAKTNDLSEWEKIVKGDFEKTQSLNTNYCRLCGKSLLNVASMIDEQKEFERRNKIHYDCAVAYQMKKREEAEKEIAERKKKQDLKMRQEETAARIAAQKKVMGKEDKKD